LKTWLTIFLLTVLILSGTMLLESCRREEYGTQPATLSFQTPPGFPPPVFSFQANPLTEVGFVLGRKLFYDGRLSIDGNFPCASCHQPEAAFTTYEHDRSHGYNNAHTLRNAPGLFNLAWSPFFNQDGSSSSLATVYEKHITHPGEMAESLSNVVNKLKGDTAYKRLFFSAFGSDQVSPDRIYRALSQFLVQMVSASSKYDRVKQGQASFNSQEQNGYQVFQAKCTSCHTEPLFTDFSFRNIGLPADPNLNDLGRMRVTGSTTDSLKFRVPSLRNLDFTSYYSHDGRFSLPRHVIRHYRNGVVNSPSLDPLLVNGIAMTDAEENDLVTFLRTLSDSAFLNNPRFRE
jgi:cytochrome c peroxidase